MSDAGARSVPLLRRLHVRITLLALSMLLLMGGASLWLAQRHARQTALEATQRTQLGLARYIVERQPRPLIDADGRPERELMASMAMYASMINPALEIYLLDAGGRIVAQAGDAPLALDAVALAPVQALAQAEHVAPLLPLLGDDPRRAGTRSIASAAPLLLDGRLAGYLYIVLDGTRMHALTQSLGTSRAWRDTTIGLAAAGALAALALLLALRRLTRPLRRLTQELRTFHLDGAGERSAAPARGDEIALLRDTTRAMQRRIDEQFARLDEHDRLRRELLGNISHDLHTPLAGIQGYAETLLLRGEQMSAATREQHLRTVLRHATRLGKRIADLFELSKLDGGRVQPRPEAFCLAELLQDVICGYQLQAQQRGVRIALAAGHHRQAAVFADIALIERVLQNLIDNALRHTPAGGDVTVAIEADGERLAVSVADTGRGIAREHLPHIFDRYWRAGEASDTAPGPSAGLGLAIVKRILDLHGCVVRVQSELMRGTRIEFALPRAE